MSNKFTGITSAGSAIPVYDKDAHSALEQKLDTSAFSSVSGDFLTEVPESAVSGFATHEEVESATSGKADTAHVVEYRYLPDSDPIYASLGSLKNVNGINGSALAVNSENLYVSGIVTATTGSIVAGGLVAGNGGLFSIKCSPEVFYGGGLTGFTFSSMNTGFGSAQLTTAAGNQIVQMYSPKFEARNVSGAGFSIEASGAKGYDHNGNVTWDTTVAPLPNSLIGYADTKATTGDLTGNIIMTVVPKSYQGSLSAIPHTLIDAGGLTATFGASASSPNIRISPNGLNADFTSSHASLTTADATVSRYSAANDPNRIDWSLTGSVQKREIECDSATSAITAIAGSAIGGKEYSAGANIDITDEVISGKDWSEDIAAATSGKMNIADMTAYQTVEDMSAYQPSGDYQAAGDYLSASESANFYPMTGNPSGFLTEHQSLDGLMETSGLEYDGDKISGYMGSAFAGGAEGVMVESAVEYNAVNEISGYNGSAIAQYGAEKQWLVHDDTIVHVSNSAQYAFGCNISALQRLMGIDETVLYETTGNRAVNSGTFSEPLSSFKYIDLYANRSNQDNNPNLAAYARICTINGVPSVQFFQAGLLAGDSMFCPIAYCNLTNTSFNFVSARNVQVTTTGTSFNIPTTAFANMGLQKAVGIGRKQ